MHACNFLLNSDLLPHRKTQWPLQRSDEHVCCLHICFFLLTECQEVWMQASFPPFDSVGSQIATMTVESAQLYAFTCLHHKHPHMLPPHNMEHLTLLKECDKKERKDWVSFRQPVFVNSPKPHPECESGNMKTEGACQEHPLDIFPSLFASFKLFRTVLVSKRKVVLHMYLFFWQWVTSTFPSSYWESLSGMQNENQGGQIAFLHFHASVQMLHDIYIYIYLLVWDTFSFSLNYTFL